MEWGEGVTALQEIAERRAAKGRPTPSWDDRPVLHEDLAEVWQAFLDLSAGRVVEWTAHPIPVTEIEAVLRLQGVTDTEDRAEWLRLIRAMDQRWLAWARQKNQAPGT